MGQPVPYETTQPLQVALLDIDDNEPVFLKPPVRNTSSCGCMSTETYEHICVCTAAWQLALPEADNTWALSSRHHRGEHYQSCGCRWRLQCCCLLLYCRWHSVIQAQKLVHIVRWFFFLGGGMVCLRFVQIVAFRSKLSNSYLCSSICHFYLNRSPSGL